MRTRGRTESSLCGGATHGVGGDQEERQQCTRRHGAPVSAVADSGVGRGSGCVAPVRGREGGRRIGVSVRGGHTMGPVHSHKTLSCLHSISSSCRPGSSVICRDPARARFCELCRKPAHPEQTTFAAPGGRQMYVLCSAGPGSLARPRRPEGRPGLAAPAPLHWGKFPRGPRGLPLPRAVYAETSGGTCLGALATAPLALKVLLPVGNGVHCKALGGSHLNGVS